MQTAAAASVTSATAFAPSVGDFRTSSSERIAPYWDAEREEWVGTPTEEEKFAALKAAVEEGFRDIDEGRCFQFSSFEEFRALIRATDEEAMAHFRAEPAAQHVDAL